MTYVANTTHIVPIFPNFPITVSTLHISEAPILHRDKQLLEFLIGEEYCHNFINQELTFLQPSTVYETTTLEDSVNIVDSNAFQPEGSTTNSISGSTAILFMFPSDVDFKGMEQSILASWSALLTASSMTRVEFSPSLRPSMMT